VSATIQCHPKALLTCECIHYRDELRAARYSALADAEGFPEICYALESLGLRLLGKKGSLKDYEKKLSEIANASVVLTEIAKLNPILQWIRTAF
jgi:hypothetical protein